MGALAEPGGVVGEGEGRLGGGLVEAQEVGREHGLDGRHVLVILATVQHGAVAALTVLHVGEGYFPNPWVGARGTGRDGTGMGQLLVECIGPERGLGVLGGEGRVVPQSVASEAGEEGVPASDQEGCTEATNVLRPDGAVLDEQLGLPHGLPGPQLLAPGLWGGVGDGVGGHLVALAVQVLDLGELEAGQQSLSQALGAGSGMEKDNTPHLGVVGPLVRDEEGGPDVAAVRVRPVLEEPPVEVAVQVVHGVVEGEKNELRGLRGGEAAGDGEAAVAGGKEAGQGAGGGLPGGRGSRRCHTC